jgi:hypothetical protein
MSDKEFVDNLWVVEYSVQKNQFSVSQLKDMLQRNRKLALDRSTDMFVPLMVLPEKELAENAIPQLRESITGSHFMDDTLEQTCDDISKSGNGH